MWISILTHYLQGDVCQEKILFSYPLLWDQSHKFNIKVRSSYFNLNFRRRKLRPQMIVPAAVFKPYCPLTLFQACRAGSTVFMERTLLIHVWVSPVLSLSSLESSSCPVTPKLLSWILWSLNATESRCFSWANPIWPFGLTHIFALLFGDVSSPGLGNLIASAHSPSIWPCHHHQQVFLLLLTPPRKGWSPSCSLLLRSPSHRAGPMLQPELYFPLTLSFLNIYIHSSTIVWFPYFLFIFWPYHSSCRTLVPRIELTPPAVDLNHWNLNHWTAREVPFPTHHHPVCFLRHTHRLSLKMLTYIGTICNF